MLRFSRPHTTAALAPPPRALTQSRTRCLPPRATTAPATTAAWRVDYRRARVNARSTYRARVRQPPPRGNPRQRHKQNHGRHVKALGRGPTFC